MTFAAGRNISVRVVEQTLPRQILLPSVAPLFWGFWLEGGIPTDSSSEESPNISMTMQEQVIHELNPTEVIPMHTAMQNEATDRSPQESIQQSEFRTTTSLPQRQQTLRNFEETKEVRANAFEMQHWDINTSSRAERSDFLEFE